LLDVVEIDQIEMYNKKIMLKVLLVLDDELEKKKQDEIFELQIEVV
jgi:hypothetical protein